MLSIVTRRRVKICAYCFVGSILAGIIAAATHRPGQDLWNNLAFNWFPGLIFGASFALGADGSRSDVVSLASVFALDYFGATQLYIRSSRFIGGVGSSFLAGFVGALVVSWASRFLLGISVSRLKQGVVVPSVGGVTGICFVLLVGSTAFKTPESIFPVVFAFVLWQTAVGTALGLSMDMAGGSHTPNALDWKWVFDALGLIGTILGIISFFR